MAMTSQLGDGSAAHHWFVKPLLPVDGSLEGVRALNHRAVQTLVDLPTSADTFMNTLVDSVNISTEQTLSYRRL